MTLNLEDIICQYPILQALANRLSTRDLVHLARTCKANNSFIAPCSPAFMHLERSFNHLKRSALCSGRGLLARQNYTYPYARGFHNYDEEVEVRVWQLRCDETGGLPCVRCSVNICEECRFVPRMKNARSGSSDRYPHIRSDYCSIYVVCYCDVCDEEVEKETGKDFCVCDRYLRWICLPCGLWEERLHEQGRKETADSTISDDFSHQMVLPDHQHTAAYWCPCGEKAPNLGNIRCTWCQRKHHTVERRSYWDNENVWGRALDREAYPLAETTPFDEDPCYPHAPPRM